MVLERRLRVGGTRRIKIKESSEPNRRQTKVSTSDNGKSSKLKKKNPTHEIVITRKMKVT